MFQFVFLREGVRANTLRTLPLSKTKCSREEGTPLPTEQMPDRSTTIAIEIHKLGDGFQFSIFTFFQERFPCILGACFCYKSDPSLTTSGTGIRLYELTLEGPYHCRFSVWS